MNTIEAVHKCEDECEELQRRIRTRRAELLEIESDYIGAKERLRLARERVYQEHQRTPVKEAGSRECEIARMLGISLELGERISDETWAMVCARRTR